MHLATFVFLITGAALVFSPGASAYMGPALGLGVIGTVIAVLAVLLLSLFAFVFVPLRRMFGRRRQKSADRDGES